MMVTEGSSGDKPWFTPSEPGSAGGMDCASGRGTLCESGLPGPYPLPFKRSVHARRIGQN